MSKVHFDLINKLSDFGLAHYVGVYEEICKTRPLTVKERNEIQVIMMAIGELNKKLYNILNTNEK